MTRPVHENVIAYDATRLFLRIDSQIRFWIDTTDLSVKPRVHASLIEAILGNYLDLSAYNEIELTADHARELCVQIAQLLKRHTIPLNAIEITFQGMGSLYYPEWP